MSARDFINNTLLPWLELRITDNAKGNRHYVAGFQDAVKAMDEFIEKSRGEWDKE